MASNTSAFTAALLAALIWIRAVRVQPPGRRARLLAHSLAAAGTFFALCGWRLTTVLLVLMDDRREPITRWDESLVSVIRCLLVRPPSDWTSVISPAGRTNLCRVE